VVAIDIGNGLQSAWNSVATFVPKLLGFLLILLIGYFVCKLLMEFVDGVLERVGFDNWVERGAIRTALERSSFDASDIVATIVFWAAFLFVLQLAFGLFGPNPVSDLLAGIIAYLPKLFVAVLILVITFAIARVVTDMLQATLGATTGGTAIAKTAGIAIVVLGVFAALNQLEIAPEIVNGLFYALLFVIVGSAVVAFGVGGIPIARRYLERWTERADQIAGEAQRTADPRAGREAVEQRVEMERERANAGETRPLST
jgi:mechanosensitive ion channel-like protein